MAPGNEAVWKQPWFLAEMFATANLGFLTLDISLAHSVNGFRRQAEYVPLIFSATAPLILLVGMALRKRWIAVWKDLGYFVGAAAILVGLAGVVLHLDSSFFYERTLRSLTYSAPFAAPLAYTGLGLLLILNRMVDADSEEWAQWVLLLTLGGFFGNFVFTLSDHAGNAFFDPREWVAVGASAIAVGFLITPFLTRISRSYIVLCAGTLACQGLVGGWGFILHAEKNLSGPSVHAWANLVWGAPPMAPLLFPNLAALGGIALWRLWELGTAGSQTTVGDS
jgi:hypothetical protein